MPTGDAVSSVKWQVSRGAAGLPGFPTSHFDRHGFGPNYVKQSQFPVAGEQEELIRCAKQSQLAREEMRAKYCLKIQLWSERADCGPVKTKPIKAKFRPQAGGRKGEDRRRTTERSGMGGGPHVVSSQHSTAPNCFAGETPARPKARRLRHGGHAKQSRAWGK